VRRTTTGNDRGLEIKCPCEACWRHAHAHHGRTEARVGRAPRECGDGARSRSRQYPCGWPNWVSKTPSQRSRRRSSTKRRRLASDASKGTRAPSVSSIAKAIS
jgi:hypothetical protein